MRLCAGKFARNARTSEMITSGTMTISKDRVRRQHGQIRVTRRARPRKMHGTCTRNIQIVMINEIGNQERRGSGRGREHARFVRQHALLRIMTYPTVTRTPLEPLQDCIQGGMGNQWTTSLLQGLKLPKKNAIGGGAKASVFTAAIPALQRLSRTDFAALTSWL